MTFELTPSGYNRTYVKFHQIQCHSSLCQHGTDGVALEFALAIDTLLTLAYVGIILVGFVSMNGIIKFNAACIQGGIDDSKGTWYWKYRDCILLCLNKS